MKIAVIGGGIVGLATAYRLLEMHPEHEVLVLERNINLASIKALTTAVCYMRAFTTSPAP